MYMFGITTLWHPDCDYGVKGKGSYQYHIRKQYKRRYKNGDAGDRTRGLSHAKRTLYH